MEKDFIKNILVEYDQLVLKNSLDKKIRSSSEYRVQQFLNYKKNQHEETISKDRKTNTSRNRNFYRACKVYRRKAKVTLRRLFGCLRYI